MAGKTYTEIVIKEIQDSVSSVDEGALDSLTEKIELERRIFCDGAGRSRLQIEGFAMRLIQMGFRSAIVGGPTVPAITAADVLLICSASGETPMLVAHAKKARSLGVRMLLITASPSSTLAALCDEMIVLRAPSKGNATDASIQPMGSLFEQSVGILFDIIVLRLMERYQISNEKMYANHANLE